ncbi:MAG TPA: ABC transporter ATP-binding protein [Prolixibacteraceae bacterium]|nr:ABC transporter ATP-binding protein [Prolixibacteraceae bacterium]HPS13731.1 ABC transporter ATP-binding protein [Prolixibacteraceae bacterium]
MEYEIQLKNLKKKYPGGIDALRGIDLTIGKGRLYALLGPNGAGKSTLVKIMTTLVRKESGEILIGGMNPETRFTEVRKHIGVALQENELDPTEMVFSLLLFQGRLFGMSKQEATTRANELIELFQLTTEKEKKAETLSGGNKRRLHCALALVHRPRVLFLDEPTVGMDPLARATFWEVITSLNQQEGVTVLVTTQYLEEADKFASEMALINEGTIRFTGTVSEFKAMVHPAEESSLEESYLKYIRSFTKS